MAASDLQHERLRLEGHGLSLAAHRFVDAAATPSGVTVLLLHGFADAGGTWDLVAGELAADGHELIAPDLRGFGGSDRVGPGGYYHFMDYVADVDAVVRARDPKRLVVVGHSMGGTVASLFTGARPERVERLALLEGVGPPAMGPDDALTRTRRWLDQMATPRAGKPPASRDDALRRLAANHPRVDRDVLATRLEHLVREEPDGTLAWAFDAMHRTTSPAAFRTDQLAAFTGAITQPVLFMSGGDLGWHPPDEAERLSRFGADVTVHTIPDAGHMMHWTRPSEVAAKLAAFIADVPA